MLKADVSVAQVFTALVYGGCESGCTDEGRDEGGDEEEEEEEKEEEEEGGGQLTKVKKKKKKKKKKKRRINTLFVREACTYLHSSRRKKLM